VYICCVVATDGNCNTGKVDEEKTCCTEGSIGDAFVVDGNVSCGCMFAVGVCDGVCAGDTDVVDTAELLVTTGLSLDEIGVETGAETGVTRFLGANLVLQYSRISETGCGSDFFATII